MTTRTAHRTPFTAVLAWGFQAWQAGARALAGLRRARWPVMSIRIARYDVPSAGSLPIARRTLLLTGSFLLGFWTWGAIRGMVVQRQFGHRLDQLIAARSDGFAPLAPAPPERKPGALLGRIDIPSVGVSGVILEGTNSELQYAVGHIEGTALPGDSGNVGLAAHRDQLFRGLRHLELDDVAKITTPDAIYSYTVEDMRIVEPSEVSVLETTAEPTLTLVTCYPFDYIGPAPRRFIVTARQTRRSAH